MIFILSILVVLGIYFYNNYQFNQSSYFKITHNSFISTIFDAGRYGEYLTYKRLLKYEQSGGKFLFNCYLPKGNGETTEIDVLLINHDGIYVFESKNYSGWIFGDEASKNWTQTLPQGKGRSRKERFFNPIMQNNLHIKMLRLVVEENIPLYSIIVFSERCTLKKITLTSQDIQVVKRNKISQAVKHAATNQVKKLSQEEVEQIYNKLLPYTQVSQDEKLIHIQNIKSNHSTPADKKDKVSSNSTIDNSINTNNSINDNIANENTITTHTEGIIDTLICPKCNAPLVLRTVKKGANIGKEFYGCSNYPKCRYIC